jgi:predicted  nucleic acid-binding Zn-ribbon protein
LAAIHNLFCIEKMLEPIEKLLILQERDRKMSQVEEELSHVPVERQQFQAKSAGANSALEAARLKMKQLESERKSLEVEIQSKKESIEKLSVQQFQTRKNEEYRAFSHQIETTKKEISGIEDRELELMEQIDAAQKDVAAATKVAGDIKRDIDSLLAGLAQREQSLKKEFAELQTNRDQLASAVDV